MIIYNTNNEVLLDIPVDDDSFRYRAVMQEKKVSLHYALPGHVELPVGAYILYQGERYTLWYPGNFKKMGSRAFEYTVEFGGNEEVLKQYKFKLLAHKPYQLKFSFTAKPELFLRLLVDNLNLYDSGWSVGTTIEATEKSLSFNHESCFSVLSRLASEFNTEWEITGKTIHLGKVEKFKDEPLALSYGRGNGFLPGVGRAVQGDKQAVTLLYVQGGDRNLPRASYGSPSLLLPRSAELVYEGRRYRTDADGMYITRADKPLAVYREDSYDASHIYPSRVGEVTGVQPVAGEDSEGNPVLFYNIVDRTIPDSLDYRACRVKGEKATLIFQSGLLTGREFDLVQTDEALTGYDPATKTFQLVPLQEGDAFLPNELMAPAVGDTYAVFHISLPPAYVCDDASRTGASWDMFREAVRYFYENEQPQFTFKGELDGIWAKKHWLEIGGKLVPGGYVDFSDNQFQPEGIAIRITGVTDYLNRPHSPTIELSNTPVAGFASDQLGKLEAGEVKNEQWHQQALSYTRRRFRDLEETGRMLEAAIEGFSSPIDPIYIQTMSLQVGSESLQFRFVASRANPVVVEHAFTYTNATKVFSTPAGVIQHMTLGIKEISAVHKPSDYRFWDMAAYTSPPLDDSSALYLYARCSKTGSSGTFLLSKTPYKMDEADAYYFLVGTLSSETDGERSFVTVYGFTEILPGRISTDKIVSSDGGTYFDLVNGEIGGRITFKGGTTGYNNIADRPNLNAIERNVSDALSQAEEASNTANQASSTANGKAMVFYTTNPGGPTAGMRINDLWVNGIDIKRWTGSSWVFVCKYDNTETQVNGGLITTGAVAVGNTGGISGSGTIRIWSGGNAGANGRPPASPTFYVDSGGNVFSGGTITATNKIMLYSNQAGISGFGTEKSSIRFWAGDSQPSNAPFRVSEDGELTASKGTIGVFKMETQRLVSTFGNMEIDPRRGIFFTNQSGMYAGLGTSALPSEAGADCCAYLENQVYSGRGSNGFTLLINCGAAVDSYSPQRWITCRHIGGWGSKFEVESRYFNDVNGMERTVINVGSLMTHVHLEALMKGSHEYMPVYYDNKTGYLCAKFN